jgi:ornithine cyclodeaminase
MQKILYLSHKNITKTGILEDKNLFDVWNTVEKSLISIGEGHTVMPGDIQLRPEREGCFDRINSKPAYMPNVAGLKWIASCCSNVEKGLPRASGIIVLNDVKTGQHFCIMDAVLINKLRTAALSMIFLKKVRPNFKMAVIIGAGPIGEEHLRQLLEGKRYGFFEQVEEICIYDLNSALAKSLCSKYSSEVKISYLNSLESCFSKDNVCLFLCTSTMTPFINKELLSGKKGLTLIHIGLRDYTPECFSEFDLCFVDVWESVCKLNTTLHVAYKKGLINKTDCIELTELFRQVTPGFKAEENMTLNPMGLPVYDLSVGHLIYKMARKQNIGTWLD